MKAVPAMRSINRTTLRTTAAALSIATIAWVAPGYAQDDADARKILKQMSDYVSGQPSISLAYDTDIEVITSELQKIQFASSGTVQLNRPDKLKVTRTGGYADVEMVFDGKTLSILGKNEHEYAQIDAPGSTDKLIDSLRTEVGMAAPGADLLLSNVYDALIEDVLEAKYVGQGVIDGVDCEHLAFRNAEVDWQLWVEIGARPVPRKYVITSKSVTGAPQYTLRIKEWRSDTPATADAFTFQMPQGGSKVAKDALADLDEVPPGLVIVGGRK